MPNIKERLRRMDASEKKNRENIRAYVDSCQFRAGDCRGSMLAHYEQRLTELMAKGAHHTHPWITDRYEADILSLSKYTGEEEIE